MPGIKKRDRCTYIEDRPSVLLNCCNRVKQYSNGSKTFSRRKLSHLLDRLSPKRPTTASRNRNNSIPSVIEFSTSSSQFKPKAILSELRTNSSVSSGGNSSRKTSATIDSSNSRPNDDSYLLEEGEIKKPVLRGLLTYNQDLRIISIQGSWDHGNFRLEKDLDPQENPEELLSGRDCSVIQKLQGFFSHPFHANMDSLMTGKRNDKKPLSRTDIICQKGVCIRLSNIGNGNLRIDGTGSNKIGNFCLSGTATPSTGVKYSYEVIMEKEYENAGSASNRKFETNALANRRYNTPNLRKICPPGLPKTPMRPEAPKMCPSTLPKAPMRPEVPKIPYFQRHIVPYPRRGYNLSKSRQPLAKPPKAPRMKLHERLFAMKASIEAKVAPEQS